MTSSCRVPDGSDLSPSPQSVLISDP
jgi:hypothetical protein